jgi:hypothetical protein
MTPLPSLLTSPTPTSVRSTLVSGLVGLGIRADLWKPGGTFSTILTVIATVFAGFANTLTYAIAAGFLGYASGPWLVLLAYYVFGVTATPATYAAGPITLTNSGGGIYSYATGTFVITNPLTGQTYVNQTPFTIGANTSISTNFQAQVAGSVATSAAGQINSVVTQALGLSCTNPAPLVGQNADTDAQVVAKCQAARAGRSALGPSGAYLNAVLNAINSSGNPVNINRVSVVNTSDMAVTVFCASPSGVPTADDLAAVAAEVLKIAQPMNVTASVVACTPVTYSPILTVWCQPGAPIASVVEEQCDAAILLYLSLYPISGLPRPPSTQGYLYWSATVGVILGANPYIFDVQGGSDEAIGPGEVLVWNGTLNVRTLATS